MFPTLRYAVVGATLGPLNGHRRPRVRGNDPAAYMC